jgi:hypothetical protein
MRVQKIVIVPASQIPRDRTADAHPRSAHHILAEGESIIEANERPGLANHDPQPTAERSISSSRRVAPMVARTAKPTCSVSIWRQIL